MSEVDRRQIALERRAVQERLAGAGARVTSPPRPMSISATSRRAAIVILSGEGARTERRREWQPIPFETRLWNAAIDVCAAVEEQRDDPEMAAIRGRGERRAASVGRVHVGTASEQELHGRAVSSPRRGDQQRGSMPVNRAYVGAMREQELDHRLAVVRSHSCGVK